MSDSVFGELSIIELEDMERAVFGSEGVALLLDEDPPETVVLVDPPLSGTVVVGAFAGSDRRDDILHIDSKGAFVLFFQGNARESSEGAVSSSVYRGTADFDGDGRDDLLLLLPSFQDLQVWSPGVSGEFSLAAEVHLDYPLPAVGIAPLTDAHSGLALYADVDIHGLRLEDGQLKEDFSFPFVSAYYLQGVAPRVGEARSVLTAMFSQQGFVTYNRVGFSTVAANSSEWSHRWADLDGDFAVTLPPVEADLDKDGRLDALVVGGTSGREFLKGFCTRGDELRECISLELDFLPQGLLLAPGAGSSTALLAAGDGLWEVDLLAGCE